MRNDSGKEKHDRISIKVVTIELHRRNTEVPRDISISVQKHVRKMIFISDLTELC